MMFMGDKTKKSLDFFQLLCYIKDMITKKVKAELDDDGKFMIVDGVLWSVVNIHNFDHEGHEMDTYTIMNFAGETMELQTYDEGQTFVEED